MTMEAVAVAVAPQPATNNTETQKKNRIQVSNTKKPLFFYVNLAKRYIQQHNEVELSALGMAITTVVTVAEILKNNGFATEKSKYSLSLSSFYPANLPFLLTKKSKKLSMPTNGAEVLTSTVGMKDEAKGRMVQKARIEIVLGKTEKFDKLMAPNNNNAAAAEAAEQATNKNENNLVIKEENKLQPQ
ncbi:uncharacterized protein At2g34160-like isoform X1 [Ipomoea triloba]|uniref:uncharacterized protein At2g34160-like isoform X1 n=1 Tax=Ipomoea triloba TaxID=35885 RepID=UPI00125D3E20|nr:uncharacterized protein At2g34160-like isoform X1 [Ipomoea triloba]